MTASSDRTPRVLSIAGSDSGGGAGIQADLKAFARCGVHGMTAITAITAQNTINVDEVQVISPDLILAQVRAILVDITVDAVKVGMLPTATTIAAVATALDELPANTPVIVDPVMVSESGSILSDTEARDALVDQILPRATVITPNLPEAVVLTSPRSTVHRDSSPSNWRSPPTGPAPPAVAGDERPQSRSPVELVGIDQSALIRTLLALGPRSVVLTAGHLPEAADLYLDHDLSEPVLIGGPRHPDGAAHGSGCTHSSVIAAMMARGHCALEAARTARALTGLAVANGLRDIGAGPGPVDVLDISQMPPLPTA